MVLQFKVYKRNDFILKLAQGIYLSGFIQSYINHNQFSNDWYRDCFLSD